MMKSEKAYRAGRVFLVFGIVFAILTLIAMGIHCMKYSWMPFELIFQMPFEILLEYVLIGAGLTVTFLGIAWICYGVAHSRAKKENAALCVAEDSAFEDCGGLNLSNSVRESRRNRLEEQEQSEAIGSLTVPAAAIGICSLAILLIGKKMAKDKRRRDFYRWLG